MTSTPSSSEHRHALKREVEFLLARSATQGLARERVHAALVQEIQAKLTGADAVAWEIGLPRADMLAVARRAQAQGRTAEWRRYCLEWLEAVHDVQLGCVIVVNGWHQPRELILDDFFLDWASDDDLPLAQARMIFSGPCTRMHAGRVATTQVCALGADVTRGKASALLRQMFPHRFNGELPTKA